MGHPQIFWVVLAVFVGIAAFSLRLWRLNRKLTKELDRFRRLADEAHDLIWIIDRNGRILYVSNSARGMLGFEPSDLMGKPLDLIATARSATAMYAELRHLLSTGELRYPRTELKYRRRDGTSLWVDLTVNLQTDENGRLTALYGIARDIDDQHRLRRQMYHLAHHDHLTDLPNRVLFFERLRASMSRARRQNWQMGILYMDLDEFKNVNDNLGHEAGDQVLTIIAERLRQSMRVEDTIARIGGDEFAAVIEQVDDEDAMQTIVAKLAELICEPIQLKEDTCSLGVSIGYVLVSQDEDENHLEVDPEKLLARADRNMYVHKRKGKELAVS